MGIIFIIHQFSFVPKMKYVKSVLWTVCTQDKMKITNCNLLCFSWDRSASLWLQVRDWKTLHHVKNYSYTSTPES